MLKSLLLLATLGLQTSSADKTATLTVSIASTPETKASTRVQVILIPPPYAKVWDAEAQQRIDRHWEDGRLLFIQRKELFIEVSRIAHRETTDFVMAQMQLGSIRMADFVRNTTVDGRFEFAKLPPGGYKLVALGPGFEGPIWEATVELTDATPKSVQLKPFP